jgi:hypothetical protein
VARRAAPGPDDRVHQGPREHSEQEEAVSDVDMMVRFIELQPDDLTAIAGLTDALMQERDMLRSEADQHAERVVQSARDARDIKTGTALVAKGAPYREHLLSLMAFALNANISTDYTVFVVAGEREPHVSEHANYDDAGHWFTGPSVLVGAQWLIRFHRSNFHLWIPAAPTPAPSSKRKRVQS